LCQRGIEAGLFGEIASDRTVEASAELEIELGFEFEQVAETDYG
jgi:hypothetical protein